MAIASSAVSLEVSISEYNESRFTRAETLAGTANLTCQACSALCSMFALTSAPGYASSCMKIEHQHDPYADIAVVVLLTAAE